MTHSVVGSQIHPSSAAAATSSARGEIALPRSTSRATTAAITASSASSETAPRSYRRSE